MSTLEAVTELRREFVRRGWNKKATGRILFELLIHAAIALGGMIVFFAFHHPVLKAAGILISGFGCMGVGTNTHTSSHYGTSEKALGE